MRSLRSGKRAQCSARVCLPNGIQGKRLILGLIAQRCVATQETPSASTPRRTGIVSVHVDDHLGVPVVHLTAPLDMLPREQA